jgi:cell fate (sporulation/competence/biofilm development) regulator YmcA (YheA/YmcA/DUF963 family)
VAAGDSPGEEVLKGLNSQLLAVHERILSSPRRQRIQLQLAADDLEQEIRKVTPPRSGRSTPRPGASGRSTPRARRITLKDAPAAPTVQSAVMTDVQQLRCPLEPANTSPRPGAANAEADAVQVPGTPADVVPLASPSSGIVHHLSVEVSDDTNTVESDHHSQRSSFLSRAAAGAKAVKAAKAEAASTAAEASAAVGFQVSTERAAEQLKEANKRLWDLQNHLSVLSSRKKHQRRMRKELGVEQLDQQIQSVTQQFRKVENQQQIAEWQAAMESLNELAQHVASRVYSHVEPPGSSVQSTPSGTPRASVPSQLDPIAEVQQHSAPEHSQSLAGRAS